MRFAFALSLLLAVQAWVYAAPAQRVRPVSVGLSFETTGYVLGEEVPLKLWVRNNTAGTLTLGKGALPSGVLDVTRVGDLTKQSLALDPGGCLPRPLQLKAGEERTFTVDLAKAADLSVEGQYFVTFGVIVRDMRYETEIKVMEVVPGNVISEGTQFFSTQPDVQRHFKLVQWTRDRVTRLFLRIEDTPSGKIYKTVLLGAYLPLVKPRLNIAPSGEVIVLHRATPEFYVRNVFWSLDDEFVHRSKQNILDPATADTARLNGMRADLEEIVDKNDQLKEALRLR